MSEASAAFLTRKTLHRMAPCGRIEILNGSALEDEHLTVKFASDESLTMSSQMWPHAQAFVSRALHYGRRHEDRIRPDESGEASVEGVRLDWCLIANEIEADVPGADRDDVFTILSFVSEVASRRYEHAGGQTAIVYEPDYEPAVHYGILDHRLVNDYKGLLVLIRDGHAALRVTRGCFLSGVLKLEREELATTPTPHSVPPHSQSRTPRRLPYPVPPQILSLASKSARPLRVADVPEAATGPMEANDHGEQAHNDNIVDREEVGPAVVFIVEADGSIDIVMRGCVRFRRVNNVWRLVCVDGAYDAIYAATRKCSILFPDKIAKHFLTLALDLAVRRRSAMLMLCKEPTTDILHHFLQREGLMHTATDMPPEAHDVRARFTQMIGGLSLSLANLDRSPTGALLRDISSIDGATVFTYTGKLLGFGCLVKNLSSAVDRAATIREGSSTMAARNLSQAGPVLRVSTDGDISLYMDEREWGYVF